MFTPNMKKIKQESLLQECEERIDHAALNVKARIVKLGDIHVVEEKYHHQCYQQLKFCPFCYGTITNTSNLDTIKKTAFSEICYSLSDKKLTLDNSGKKKPNFISLCTPPHPSKHLKRRLAESVAQVKPNASKLKNDLSITLLCQLMMHIIPRR